MRKRVVGAVMAVMLAVGTIAGGGSMDYAIRQVKAADTKANTNPNIDVGSKIYVQHDEENKDVYDLKKSEEGKTTVYEVILPKFTTEKAWTRDGEYIDNLCEKYPHNATAPEDYIPVKANERYFFRIYGVGMSEGIWYVPVLFLDDNDKKVGEALTATFSKSKSGVVVTVPEGATKMHLTMFNHQNMAIQKEIQLTSEEFDELPDVYHKEKITKDINQKYEEYQKDRMVYGDLDKGYITFVNDDTQADLDKYAEVFEKKNIPLVLATIPEGLIEEASSKKETRLEVARRVVANGGEIIAHNAEVLTQEKLTDYNPMYASFVKTKQMFNMYGFDVNGIILAGGSGLIVGAKETEAWASSFYQYSDLYGVDLGDMSSTYFHRRSNLGNYKNDVECMKKLVDDIIENKTWNVFYFHGFNEITRDNLETLLDYVNEKVEDDLEVVTYKEMYDMSAMRKSDFVTSKRTYYVSSSGSDTAAGLDQNSPMSYKAAQSRKFKSGDTILFRCGDVFYGSFSPQIWNVDDSVTTISSYGKGEKPTICGYKIVDKEDLWSQSGEGVYKAQLNDSSKFSGIMTTDENSTNIGFIVDKNGTKYYNKKAALNKLTEEYDFYCDGAFIYVKSSKNPYKTLGEVKLATKTNLLYLKSNMKVEKLRVTGTGAHALLGSDPDTKNLEISDNIIEDVGGSFLRSDTRYGNGIELYGTNASNVVVKDNIIRNTYDVGFTMQGTKGSGKNVVVKDNVFVQNTQDSEIWESGEATGIESYEFTNNISVDSGRGWGYAARPDKYAAAHIIFWGYDSKNTDIYFHHNIAYNPKRVYFVEQTGGTNIYFKEENYIKSDYNKYYLADDARIFRDYYKLNEKENFVTDYKKDMNSEFHSLDEFPDDNVSDIAATTDDINEIKEYFGVKTSDVGEARPTVEPTMVPVEPTVAPTVEPTVAPTVEPTVAPTVEPTVAPTVEPTVAPTADPIESMIKKMIVEKIEEIVQTIYIEIMKILLGWAK